MSNLLECTRCGSELRCIEPNATWLRYFACDECWLAFRLQREWNKRHTNYALRLEQGRKPRTPANESLGTSVSVTAWKASVTHARMLAKDVKLEKPRNSFRSIMR